MRQEHAPGLARFVDLDGHVQQFAGDRARQADALQTAPEVGLLRLAALQLIPGQRAELHFQQFAQAQQLRAHGIEQARVDRRGRGRLCRGRGLHVRFDQRLGGGQRLPGEQLAVVVTAVGAVVQLGLHGGDARVGLAQLMFQLGVGHARGQRGQLVVQRRRQFDTAGDAPVTDDGGIGAKLIPDQLHGLTHIGSEKTLNLHNPLPQPLGPTVATMVTCLLSGIS
ncbi:hypothetical protein D3C76_872760 [compost metagenome]